MSYGSPLGSKLGKLRSADPAAEFNSGSSVSALYQESRHRFAYRLARRFLVETETRRGVHLEAVPLS
jgi:hypothetical protein